MWSRETSDEAVASTRRTEERQRPFGWRERDACKSHPGGGIERSWLMRRICLGWEKGFKHTGRFLASETLDGGMSWGWITQRDRPGPAAKACPSACTMRSQACGHSGLHSPAPRTPPSRQTAALCLQWSVPPRGWPDPGRSSELPGRGILESWNVSIVEGWRELGVAMSCEKEQSQKQQERRFQVPPGQRAWDSRSEGSTAGRE